MKLPRRRKGRRNGLLAAGIALGAVLLALPLLPSFRRYVRIESM